MEDCGAWNVTDVIVHIAFVVNTFIIICMDMIVDTLATVRYTYITICIIISEYMN